MKTSAKIFLAMLLFLVAVVQAQAQRGDAAFEQRKRLCIDILDKAGKAIRATDGPETSLYKQMESEYGHHIINRYLEELNCLAVAAVRHRQIYDRLTPIVGAAAFDSLMAIYADSMSLTDYYEFFVMGRMADVVTACTSDRSGHVRRLLRFRDAMRKMKRDTTGLGLPSRQLLHSQPLFNVVGNMDKETQHFISLHQYSRQDTDFIRKDKDLIRLIHYTAGHSSAIPQRNRDMASLLEEKRRRLGERHPAYALTLTMQSELLFRNEATADSARRLLLQAADIYRRNGSKLGQRLVMQQLSHQYWRDRNRTNEDSLLLLPLERIDHAIAMAREEIEAVRPVLGERSFEVRMARAEIAMLHDARDTIVVRRREDLNPARWAQAVATYRQGRYREAYQLFDALRKDERYDYLTTRRDYVWQWMASCAHKMGTSDSDPAEAILTDPFYTLDPVDRALTLHADSVWTYADDPDRSRFLTECRQLFGEQSQQYVRMLLKAYASLQEQKRYVDAINVLVQARNISRSMLSPDHPVYGRILTYLGRLYRSVNYYQEAVTTLEEAVPLIAATDGRQSAYYASNMASLFVACRQLKDNDRMARWGTDLADVLSDPGQKALVLNVTGRAMHEGADGDSTRLRKSIDVLERAIYWQRRSIDSLYSKDGRSPWNRYHDDDYYTEFGKVLTAHFQQAEAYRKLGRCDMADSLSRFCCDTLAQIVASQFETRVAEHHSISHLAYRRVLNDWAVALRLRAISQNRCAQYDQEIATAREALRVSRESRIGAGLFYGGEDVLVDNNDIGARRLIVQALYKQERYQEAERELLLAQAEAEETFGRSKDYYTLENDHATLLSKMGRQAEAAQCISNYWHYLSNDRLRQLVLLNPRERERFWADEKKFFEETFTKTVYNNRQTDSYALLYDNTLLCKGLLLNTEMEIGRLISEGGSAEQQRLYRELQQNQLKLTSEMQKDKRQRTLDTDSLRAFIRSQEYELLNALQQSNNEQLAANLRTSWTQVRDHLKEGDVAIEFVTIPVTDDSLLYAALTLHRNSQQPRFTPLFTRHQLQQADPAKYYTSTELYRLVWQPIADEIATARRIFFSPTGALHQIAIEYLPGMEQLNACRLSSTRELVRPATAQRLMQAALYGGIKYEGANGANRANRPNGANEPNGANGANGANEANEAHEPAAATSQQRLLRDLRGSARRMPVLAGSLREVQDIGQLMQKKHIDATIATGSQGTEESLKALSGSKLSVLHISTHGFYQPPTTQATKLDDFAIPSTLDAGEQAATQEDVSLSRSGLLLAGAADHIFGRATTATGDDGILTAREIARLDLRTLDLVVLSACETGLGDVSGEGVFGLQRGFKKAGARTLLMSLWKVDDQATQVLMTEFYRQLLDGKTKRQAFLTARQHLRQADGGRYDRPDCWAAFVMLDGETN